MESSTIYTSEDVYNFSRDGNVDDLIIALNQNDNTTSNCYRDSNDYTALHIAVKNGHIIIVEILLDNGIDINTIYKKGKVDYTILHLAALYGHTNIIKILLLRGIDNNKKCTLALHGAVANGFLNIVELLLENGYDINNKTKSGNTLLHISAWKDHIHIVKRLLELGIDINNKNNKNCTALHYAAENDNIDIVEFLIMKNIDINIKDSDGFTSLHLASWWGNRNTVKILLDNGIDIDNDIDNYYPMDGDMNRDCRSLIVNDLEQRKKRIIFDSLINHYIEYQPYINSIYTLCYPTGNRKVAKPPVGWIVAEEIRNKYYFDEIFFYLHMHIANCYSNKRPGVVVTSSSSSLSNSSDYFANNSDKTSTLMIILTDSIKKLLKPKQSFSY